MLCVPLEMKKREEESRTKCVALKLCTVQLYCTSVQYTILCCTKFRVFRSKLKSAQKKVETKCIVTFYKGTQY